MKLIKGLLFISVMSTFADNAANKKSPEREIQEVRIVGPVELQRALSWHAVAIGKINVIRPEPTKEKNNTSIANAGFGLEVFTNSSSALKLGCGSMICTPREANLYGQIAYKYRKFLFALGSGAAIECVRTHPGEKDLKFCTDPFVSASVYFDVTEHIKIVAGIRQYNNTKSIILGFSHYVL